MSPIPKPANRFSCSERRRKFKLIQLKVMKRTRLLTILVGAIFFVALMSLYRMLEVMQRVELEHKKAKPVGELEEELFQLHQKIEGLEHLLNDNNQLVAKLRDSLDQHKELLRRRGGANMSSDSYHKGEALPGCRRAEEVKDGTDGVQMLNVYDILPFDNPDGGAWKQGFEIHYQDNEWDKQPLELFLVPHSHNDPGWLKTFDRYYQDQTQHILNNMVTKLSEDSRRKMIWAEISYFSKWWYDIDEQKREMVKRLLKAGQLEMVTGGWVMADEANSHYFAMLDQLIEGHQWMQHHLGVKPSVGWAVDPFGHSPSMTYLLKGAGLRNMVIQRVHYAVKKHFARQHTLEFLWRQSWDPSSRNDIMCHMMPFYSYDVPHTCGPNPAVCCQFDFHRLPGRRVSCPWRIPPQPITDQNVHERALLLLDQYRQKSRLFRSSVLLVPLGDDFRYTESSEWDVQFNNYQKIFDYFSQHSKLHIKARFGTLSDYFEALHRRLNTTGTTLPTVRGDFFTYADRDDHYWSGYFTSRPFYKRLDRTLEAMLRATEILFSLTLAEMRRFHGDGRLVDIFPARQHFKHLTMGRRSLGLFQHHDGITGTARDPVVADYGTRLLHSILNLRQVMQSSAHWLLLLDKSQYYHDQSKPFLLMDDVIAAQDALPQKTPLSLSDEPRALVIFNPTEQFRTSVISVVVDSPDAHVINAETGRPVAAQISAVWVEPSRVSSEAFQLDFVAELPPLSLVIYHVTKASAGSSHCAEYTILHHSSPVDIEAKHFQVSHLEGDAVPAQLSLGNKHIQIWSSPETGLLKKVRLQSGLVRQVQVQFLWYGTTVNQDKSGAYLFLPGKEGAQLYSSSQPPLVRVSRGPVFSEITSRFQHFTHRVRLYHLDGHAGRSLEISNLVDIRSESNRELAMRLVSDVANGNRFYSDLNGFQMQQRRTLSKLPLQANFYPMTSASFLQDSSTRMTLLSGQSHGVASLKPGELEVILDRRLQQDDNRGLGQGVTDNKLTQSLYHLLLEERRGGAQEVGGASVEHLSMLAHLTSLSLCHPPLTMVVPGNRQLPKLRPFLPLKLSLPCDVHLLNLRTLEDEKEAESPSQEVALLLHRKGFDCSSDPKMPLQCTWSEHEESHLTTVTPQTFRVQPAQQRISWEMASGRSRRRRRSSRDEPPDFCDVTSRHVEQVRSFKRWFDLSEPRMRQMESEFQKVVGQVKEIRRTTDTFIKGGTVSGILGLVICVVGVMAAPFTGGVSLPAAAAFGVAVAAFGRAVAVGAKVKKTIKERCGAKEAEKLGKEFMEIIKPIQNDLEGIQVLHKKLAEKPTDVRGEGVLAETEEFEKILSELRSKRGNMSDVVFAVMKEINATLRLVTNFFRVTATPQEDDKFSDAIFKSAHQYQKVLGEFDLMKMELQDL